MSYMRVEQILQSYRPGSGDWTWVKEFSDLWRRDYDALEALILDVSMNGMREPLLLGDDGRLWDGHHRLIAAVSLTMLVVPVSWGHTRAGDAA